MLDPLDPRPRRARSLRGGPADGTGTTGAPPRRRRALVALALAATLGVLAAGCGESTDSDSSTPGTVARQDVQRETEGPPQPGGELLVGLAGETNSFSPSSGQWSSSAYLVANAVLEPLVSLDAEANPQPYLAQAVESNADFTEWTITLRPGITFHNGEALDAAAVKANLDNVRTTGVTAQAFAVVESVEVQGDDAVVVKLEKPWSTFPQALTLQPGYMVAPAMLADAEGAAADPIGTGPFKVEERQSGAFTKTVKNPDYWQKDADGNQLPYLDEIEFRVVPEATARETALEAGDLDVAQVVTPESLLSVNEKAAAGELQLLTDSDEEVDETVLAFNTAVEPFNDPVARQALAYALDQEALAEIAFSGAMPGAWGLFEEGSPYYLSKEEAGYPEHNPEKARELLADYEQRHGKPLSFSVLVPPDPQYMTIVQAYQAEAANYGIDIRIEPVEQATLITRVVATGDFQASGFLMWSSPSVDQGYVFLALPPNPTGLSLNYSRFDDTELREAMDAFRSTTDEDARIEAMATVQKQLAKNLQVLFLAHNRTALAFTNDVHGLRATMAPGTEDPVYSPYPTTPFFTSAWKSAS